MAPRPKPVCMTASPDDVTVLSAILFGDDSAPKTEARQQVSKITALWQHWTPRLKSAIRSDVSKIIEEGGGVASVTSAGYSDSLARIIFRDLGQRAE